MLKSIYYRIVDTSLSHNELNKKLMVASMLECLENHYKYMLEHPGNKYWMHAFVLDLRRLNNGGLDRVVCSKDERKSFIIREKEIIRKIIHHLPIFLRLNYVILLICAVSPTLILHIQMLLRNIKQLKSKMIIKL